MDWALSKWSTTAKVHLAHEIGHCVCGAFYNPYSSFDIRQKHEHRADKWAIKKLIPVDELDEAVAAGHTELWDLADYFGVTEEFMKKAVCWYTHGNLEYPPFGQWIRSRNISLLLSKYISAGR